MEQVILKGGNYIVVGNAYRNVIWSNAFLDSLLIKCLKNKRYQKVTVLLLDRKVDDLLSIIRHHCRSNNIIYEQLVTANRVKFLSIDEIDEINSFNWFSRSEQTNEDNAVFIYSLSEYILNYSASKVEATKFVTKLIRMTSNRQHAESRADISLLVANIHQSLHLPSITSYMQSLFSGVIRIAPPIPGTLANEVAAEIQIVRRSENTMKVNESLEMFTWSKDETILLPIQVTEKSSHSDTASKNRKDETEGFIEAEDRNAVEKSDQGVHQENFEVKDSLTVLGTNSASTAKKPVARLITFDSTDPEFDEDDDPDADLDL